MSIEKSTKCIFNLRIAQLMKHKALNQKDLALLANIGQSAISQYIKGLRQPRAEELCKLADALGVSMDYLWGRTDINNIAIQRKPTTNPQTLALAKQLVRMLDDDARCNEDSNFYAAEGED